MELLDVIRDRSFEANFLNIWKNVLYVMAGSDFILHTYLDLSQVLRFLIILRPAFFFLLLFLIWRALRVEKCISLIEFFMKREDKYLG